jgi:hypothetical protein
LSISEVYAEFSTSSILDCASEGSEYISTGISLPYLTSKGIRTDVNWGVIGVSNSDYTFKRGALIDCQI